MMNRKRITPGRRWEWSIGTGVERPDQRRAGHVPEILSTRSWALTTADNISLKCPFLNTLES